MYKNIFFSQFCKMLLIVSVGIGAGMFYGCKSTGNNPNHSEFSDFEKEFAKTLLSFDEKDINTVRLIAFNKFPIANDSIKLQFEKIGNGHRENMRKLNIVFSDDFSHYRQYFPLNAAIVEYNGKTYTADEKGVVRIPNLKNIEKITLIGRKRSESVQGTGSNIIEEDRIVLKNPVKQEIKDGVLTGYSIEGNICVFDMGVFKGMD